MKKIPFNLADFQRTGLAETRDGRQLEYDGCDTKRFYAEVGRDYRYGYKLDSNGRFFDEAQASEKDLLYVLTPEKDMKPEYQKIVDDVNEQMQLCKIPPPIALAEVAARIAALPDRPRVPLTDEQKRDVLATEYNKHEPTIVFSKRMYNAWQKSIDAVLAAHDNRPYVSEDVPFDLKKYAEGGWESGWEFMYMGNATKKMDFEELKAHPDRYTMRRKGTL